MSSTEEIFIIKLKHHMSSLKDTRNTKPSNVRNPYNMAEIASASILAILSGGMGVSPPIKSYKDGIWKYSDIQKFIINHSYFLVKVFPSLERLPTKEIIRQYLTNFIDLDDFIKSFIQWTEIVNQSYESIKPCNEVTAKSGVNSKPNRAIILAVHAWKQQNLEIEKIVDQLFSDAGKTKARIMIKNLLDKTE